MNLQTMENTGNLVSSNENTECACAIEVKPEDNNELKFNRSFSVKQYKNNKHTRTKEKNRTSFKFFANISRKPLDFQASNTPSIETCSQLDNVLGHVPLHEPFSDSLDLVNDMKGCLKQIMVTDFGSLQVGEQRKRVKTIIVSGSGISDINEDNKIDLPGNFKILSKKYLVLKEVPTLKECRVKNPKNTLGETLFTSQAVHTLKYCQNKLTSGSQLDVASNQLMLPEEKESNTFTSLTYNQQMYKVESDHLPFNEFFGTSLELKDDIKGHVEQIMIPDFTSLQSDEEDDKNDLCLSSSNDSVIMKELISQNKLNDKIYTSQEVNIMEESNMCIKNKCNNDPKIQFKSTELSEKAGNINGNAVFLVKDNEKSGQKTAETNIKCQECSLISQNIIDFIKHVQVSHKTFHCDKCNKIFTNIHIIMCHLKTDIYAKNQCNYCNEVFTNRFCYDRHVNNKFCVTRYKCKICGICNKNNKEAQEHKKTHVGEKRFSCIQCSKKFKHEYSLKNHCLSHIEEKKMVCSVCDKSFLTPTQLKNHTKYVHTDKKHECPICNKNFKTIYQLKYHSTLHSEQLPFLCSVCGKRFRLKDNLNRHAIRHGEKLLLCSICGKKFFQKKSLISHMRVHTGDYLKCSQCSCSFTSSQQLKRHMYLHSAEKRFQCELCDRKFYQKQCLDSHLKSHKKSNKQFMKDRRCSICNIAVGELNCPLSFHLQEHRQKGENRRSFVKSHLQTHSEGKRYQCFICKRYLRDNHSLKRHHKLHAEQRLYYKCDHCSKSFYQKISLTHHKCVATHPAVLVSGGDEGI